MRIFQKVFFDHFAASETVFGDVGVIFFYRQLEQLFRAADLSDKRRTDDPSAIDRRFAIDAHDRRGMGTDHVCDDVERGSDRDHLSQVSEIFCSGDRDYRYQIEEELKL